MTDAPETIDLLIIAGHLHLSSGGPRPASDFTHYTRTDVAKAAIAERDAVIEGLVEALETIRDKRQQCNRAIDCQHVARAALSRAKGEG